jgi:hypothetical protein
MLNCKLAITCLHYAVPCLSFYEQQNTKEVHQNKDEKLLSNDRLKATWSEIGILVKIEDVKSSFICCRLHWLPQLYLMCTCWGMGSDRVKSSSLLID